jgi:predicted nucleic acid-binding protein
MLALADTIVAAVALERHCRLVTDNERDFPMPELKMSEMPE